MVDMFIHSIEGEKDGAIKLFNMMDYLSAGDPCNVTWWRAATISSGLSGSITYTKNDSCSNDPSTIFPYVANLK